jgi:hypothetical protein
VAKSNSIGNESAVTGRRAFLAACGAVVAASALPAVPLAAPQVARAAPPGADVPRLANVCRAAWRAAYLEALDELAATLRPRFEAGELYAFRDDQQDYSGQARIGDACAKHFGLIWSACEDGDTATARMILAASPHAPVAGVGSDVHPCDHATEAVAWDVIAIARERGWYTPPGGECSDPLLD